MEMTQFKTSDAKEPEEVREQQETEFTDLEDREDRFSATSFETPRTGLYKSFPRQSVQAEAKNIGYFLEDVLLMEKDVVNPRFVKYLMNHAEATSRRYLTNRGLVTEYTEYGISYYGEPFRNDDGVLIRPAMNFKTTNGVISDPNEFNQAVSDIRYHYDKFRDLELRRKMKRAGVVTAIGLSISGLITGLAIGLRRRGSDMVRNSKQQSKIGPSKKVPEVLPWTELQDATGKSFILVGDHIYLVIGGLAYLYYTSER